MSKGSAYLVSIGYWAILSNMQSSLGSTIKIGNADFEIIKDNRLREGIVVKNGNIYGRVGPKEFIQEELAHTIALYERGFPVPKVLDSGELSDGNWYFTETSLGKETFHSLFEREYQSNLAVSEKSFNSYLQVVKQYFNAQVQENNRSHITPDEFIGTVVPNDEVIPNYEYFGHDSSRYFKALRKASSKLLPAPMGILQFDLNPYNMLENGVIDFELVGYGPIGYDILMSARWGGTWFTEYPSRYPNSYKLTKEQLDINDNLIRSVAKANSLPGPMNYLQEFLLLKSAWALAEPVPPQPDWPQDKLAFRNYRANVLKTAVDHYLSDIPMDYMNFSRIPGGELMN